MYVFKIRIAKMAGHLESFYVTFEKVYSYNNLCCLFTRKCYVVTNYSNFMEISVSNASFLAQNNYFDRHLYSLK